MITSLDRLSTALKTFVINLRRRPDRRAYMQGQLDRLGVTFEWLEAIDAKRVDFEARLSEAKIVRDGPWGEMSNATLACTLSHMEALRLIANGDSRYGLILEDDAKLSSEIVRFAGGDDWVPVGADVVRLEYWNDHKQIIAFDKTRYPVGRFDLQRLRSRTAGCAGYVVSREFAQYLVDHPQVFTMPIDHVLFNFGASQLARRRVIFQLIPSVVVQDPIWESDLASSLGPKRKWVKVRRGFYELWQGLRAFARVGLGLSEMKKNRFDA